MTINEKQVEELFRFCRKHYVRYYDVQVELSDHLATAIENEIARNPALDFQQALDIVYMRFGKSGFSDIVKEKTNAVKEKQRTIILEMVFSLIKWPHFLFIGLIILAEYLCTKYFSIGTTVIGFIGFATVTVIVLVSRVTKIYKKQTLPLLATDFGSAPLSCYYSLGFNIFFLMLSFFNMFWSIKSIAVDNGTYYYLCLINIFFLLEVGYLLAFKKNQENLQKEFPLAFK